MSPNSDWGSGNTFVALSNTTVMSAGVVSRREATGSNGSTFKGARGTNGILQALARYGSVRWTVNRYGAGGEVKARPAEHRTHGSTR